MKSSKTISTDVLLMFILTNQHVRHLLTVCVCVYVYTLECDAGDDDDIVVTGGEEVDEDRISQLLCMSIFFFHHLNLFVGSSKKYSMCVQLE